MARGSSKPAARASKRSQPGSSSSGREQPPPNRGSAPLKLLQQCLDIFRETLRPGHDDHTVLQEVKGHLFNRDYFAAFGKEDYLRVYASRWSPVRALAYFEVLRDIEPYLQARGESADDTLRVACIGGGAGGELIALAGWHNQRSEIQESPSRSKLDVKLVDIAEWSPVVDVLVNGITTPPELSKYASQAKKDANKAMLDKDILSVDFQRLDVLNLTLDQQPQFASWMKKTALVTLMFTLNELYSTSMVKTQQLLSLLTQSMAPGSCLLVVDSPGSYSTVSINNAEKKYPMQWLLEHTLLGTGSKEGQSSDAGYWEKLVSDDSRWFRLSDTLQYPIDLENMRYQIYLYRRLGDDGG